MSRRRAILIALGVGMAAAGAVFFLARPSGLKRTSLARREHAMELLGATIAKLRPKSKILVLSNPFTKASGYLDEKKQYEHAAIEGLRSGLRGKVPITVIFPDIRPEFTASPESAAIPPDSSTPLSFLLQASSIDELAAAHTGSDVVVSLIGLPVGVTSLKIWSDKDPHSFALLLPDLRVLGTGEETVAAFQREKLLAAVVHHSRTGEPLVVTKENVAEVLRCQPGALGF